MDHAYSNDMALTVTLTAGWQKIFRSNPAIGFLSHAAKFREAYGDGEVLAPAKDLGEMRANHFQ